MPDLAWMTVLAYLVGSVSGSLVLGRLRGLDIRVMGSGNAGGTNALRSVGWAFALMVVIIDVGKGAIAALIPKLPLIWGESLPIGPTSAAAVCGMAAVIGHVWPVYFDFRGGKGAGTAVGAIAVVSPWCILPLLVVWVVTLLGTGYVGLATILAGLSLVPAMWLLGPDPVPVGLGIFAIALAGLLLFTHRGNLARMKSGTENRFEKARLLKRRR
ncbi:MAG: glycerol-3-phosphate 1-O-acyltransferase PlsY [Wenzhouxiangellaceae bacterium]|nr:glycerol-3-phosphate 1-O-acyltransferase PlsY [Wenzhouxiangellaceae bacterium]